MEVFQVVAEYIREKQGQHRSVLSVSWVSTISIDHGSFGGNYNMEVRIKEVTTNPHVPIDFEAGNSAKALDHKNLRPRLRADLFPASLVDKPLNESKPPHKRLLGAANSKQADTVFLAPEVDIKCATHNSSIGEHEDTSTSFC